MQSFALFAFRAVEDNVVLVPNSNTALNQGGICTDHYCTCFTCFRIIHRGIFTKPFLQVALFIYFFLKVIGIVKCIL